MVSAITPTFPAVFVHGDLGMSSLIEERATYYHDPIYETWSGITRFEDTENYLDKYPMGVAVMELPFFIPAHIGTLILTNFINVAPNGFTKPYEIMIGLSGMIYMIAGLFILKRFLDKYFRPKVVYFTLLVLLFGTNLYHYGTYDSGFSHTFSFFLFAALLYFLPKWYNKINFKNSIILGIISGMIMLVRPTNGLVLMIIPLWGLSLTQLPSFLKKRIQLFWQNKLQILTFLLTSMLILLPQIFYWKYITGQWLFFSYQGEYFDFANPQIGNVLFSIQKGLFFWAPVLLFGVIGLGMMFVKIIRSKLKAQNKSQNSEQANQLTSQLVNNNANLRSLVSNLLLPITLYLLLNIYVISSWWAWSYGGSYGHRAFIESFALFAIPMAYFYKFIFGLKNRFVKYLVLLLSIALCLLSLYTMFLYWKGLIPIDGTNWEVYVNALKGIKTI